jgi:hypothetical protein
MHNRFEEVLKSITISPDTADGVKERLKVYYQEMLQATEEATRESRAQISDISAKLKGGGKVRYGSKKHISLLATGWHIF